MIICDTDVGIDIWRKHPPAVAWAQSVSSEELVLPGFVAMELVQGCRSKPDLIAVLETLRPFRLVWPAANYCQRALQNLLDLHLSHGVVLTDALIAQTAIALNLPLHTFNQRHFDPIPRLRTIQPYIR